MSDTTAITPAAAREGFGTRELTAVTETASTAAAAQARAAIEARYIMAMQRPRDWDTVRVRLLKECMRPGFAAAAIYSKPVGKGQAIEGLSIRFAEAALRCITNMLPETMVIYDDNRKRILRVQVTDLESNVTYANDIVIEKTVERRQVKQGQEVLGKRMNSYGNLVYLVEATEGDLVNKQGSEVSKQIRNLAMRMLPGDIQDDCLAQLYATQRNDAAKDPAAARKALVDAYAGLGIEPAQLTKYLGHSLDGISPDETVELRKVFSAVKTGEASWHEILAERAGGDDDDGKKESAKQQSAKDKIKAAHAKATEEPKKERPEPPPASDKEMQDLGYGEVQQ